MKILLFSLALIFCGFFVFVAVMFGLFVWSEMLRMKNLKDKKQR